MHRICTGINIHISLHISILYEGGAKEHESIRIPQITMKSVTDPDNRCESLLDTTYLFIGTSFRSNNTTQWCPASALFSQQKSLRSLEITAPIVTCKWVISTLWGRKKTFCSTVAMGCCKKFCCCLWCPCCFCLGGPTKKKPISPWKMNVLNAQKNAPKIPEDHLKTLNLHDSWGFQIRSFSGGCFHRLGSRELVTESTISTDQTNRFPRGNTN